MVGSVDGTANGIMLYDLLGLLLEIVALGEELLLTLLLILLRPLLKVLLILLLYR